MSELSLVVDDADAEFAALEQLINFTEVAVDDGRGLQPRARLAASNAAILFVASAFEESVRQLGSAYARELVQKPQIPQPKLAAIKAGLWEKSSQQLFRKSMGSVNFDEDAARLNVSILRDFCLDLNDITLMIEHAVYHSHNLKVKEVNGLFKRLGVENICPRAGRSIEYRSFFLVPSVAEAQVSFIRFLDEFYEIRNSATHNLAAFRAQGAVDTLRFVLFFRLAVQRIASVLQDDLDAMT